MQNTVNEINCKQKYTIKNKTFEKFIEELNLIIQKRDYLISDIDLNDLDEDEKEFYKTAKTLFELERSDEIYSEFHDGMFLYMRVYKHLPTGRYFGEFYYYSPCKHYDVSYDVYLMEIEKYTRICYKAKE